MLELLRLKVISQPSLPMEPSFDRPSATNDDPAAASDQPQTQTYTYRGKTYTRAVAPQPQAVKQDPPTMVYRGAAYPAASAPVEAPSPAPMPAKMAVAVPTPVAPTPSTVQRDLGRELAATLAELEYLDMAEIIPLLGDDNHHIRARAAAILGSWGDEAKAAIPQLVSLLSDPVIEVKFWAAKTLLILDQEKYSFTYKYIEALYTAQQN
jgi:hypothetical protein